MRIRCLIAVVCLTPLPVRAADLPVYAPPAMTSPTPVAFNWSGFHVGGYAGWGWGDVDANELFTTAFGGNFYGATGNPYGFDADGFIAGAQAGYDWQWNRFVVGAGADIGWMDADGSVIDPNFPPVPLGSERPVTSFEGGINGALTGRVGVALNRVLLYARAGIAFLDAEGSTIDPCGRSFCGVTTIEAKGDDLLLGWTLGGGVEVALSEHWRVGAEYRYYDFQDLEVSGVADNFLTYSQDLDFDVHTARAFVNYRW